MNEKNNELLPCPFCKGTEINAHSNGYQSHMMVCDDCGAEGPAALNDEAAKEAWNRRATPPASSSAPSGGMHNQAEFREACQRRGMEPSQELFTLWQDARAAAHPAAVPDSAQQGEDEPPLPPATEGTVTGARRWSASRMYQFARTYHAHMMRKLGDGASIDTEEFNILLGTWMELRDYYQSEDNDEVRQAWASFIAHIDAKLAQARAAGAERAVPEGWKQAAAFIEKKAQDYINEHADTEHDTGAVVWRYGDAGRDYHSSLVELAEELRAAAPSPAAAKEGGEA